MANLLLLKRPRLEEETRDYRDRVHVVSSISTHTLSCHDRLVKRLKRDKLWDSQYDVSTYGGNSLAGGLVKLKNLPGVRSSHTNINFVEQDFNERIGLVPGSNNTSKYLRNGIIPNAHLNLTSVHLAWFGYAQPVTGQFVEMSASQAGSNTPLLQLYVRSATSVNHAIFDAYSAAPGGRIQVVNSDVACLTVGSRTSSTSATLYKNGEAIGSVGGSNGSRPTGEILFFAKSTLGSPEAGRYSNIPCGFASIGLGLTQAQVLLLNEHVLQFQREMGRIA